MKNVKLTTQSIKEHLADSLIYDIEDIKRLSKKKVGDRIKRVFDVSGTLYDVFTSYDDSYIVNVVESTEEDENSTDGEELSEKQTLLSLLDNLKAIKDDSYMPLPLKAKLITAINDLEFNINELSEV